jgi:hypothetical protein
VGALIKSSRLGSDNATTPVPSFLLVDGASHRAGVQLRMLRIPRLAHPDSILLMNRILTRDVCYGHAVASRPALCSCVS